MSSFKHIIHHVLDLEGGYVDDPDDAGGATHFGVSARSYPDIDIETLTREHAIAIYERDYWRAYSCDLLPPAIGCFLFDSLVQHRPRTAVTMLQQALGVTADGIIGPVTITASEQAVAAEWNLAGQQPGRAELLLVDLFTRRTDLYAGIASGVRAKFRTGWFRRLCRLQQFIYCDLAPRGGDLTETDPMNDQPEQITGYRDLTGEEIELMNRVKGAGQRLDALVSALRIMPDADQRWVSIGATDLQTGLMALSRAVANPDLF